MKRNILSLLIIIICLGFQPFAQAQTKDAKTQDKRIQKFSNWQNADLKKDKKNGISTDKAYEELLKGKTSTPIIVAVIDGGVDIFHEDLKEVIWTNPKEIPDNGIDDDNNGYIDDVHGWSFIGVGKKGSLVKESYELTREYSRLSKKYKDRSKSAIQQADTAEYSYFKYVKGKFMNKYDFAEAMLKNYQSAKEDFEQSTLEVKKYLQKDTVTLADLKAIKATQGSSLKQSVDYMLKLMNQGLNGNVIQSICAHFEKQVNVDYNTEYNGRKEVGDDPDNFKDVKYGNNDVKGSKPTHGTMVAGLIAAKRNNNIGINGVADNVQIMPILVVPDGDERDKDVALAIRYATDNGAKIINMSFGKEFSPNKKETLLALEYAAAHNVLLVHAAGNDALSNDTIMHYPSAYMNKTSTAIPSFIEVGASTLYKNKKIPASFSNYGATTVDIFAPGEDIYTTYPENTYQIASGTSFSSPIMAGVAALIWSYYPKLTAKQVKEIIIKSGVSFADKKVLRPSTSEKAPKTKFGQLSISGKVVNVYNALKLAETYTR